MLTKLAIALALAILAAAMVGIGFGLGLKQPDQIANSVLHSPGILVWSIVVGNGIVWLMVHAARQLASLRFGARPLFFGAQVAASLVLDITMANGWYIASGAVLPPHQQLNQAGQQIDFVLVCMTAIWKSG